MYVHTVAVLKDGMFASKNGICKQDGQLQKHLLFSGFFFFSFCVCVWRDGWSEWGGGGEDFMLFKYAFEK